MAGFNSVIRALPLLVALAFGGMSAHAATDPLIEGGRLCTQQFPRQEQQYRIPTHLLAAISTTESGRWHKGLGIAVPWPWTINVNGKGYYFASKAEAIAQTQNLIAQGQRSIDVGCMQVNLKHHAKAFSNLEDAFEPEKNVAYAAKFLRDNYGELGDWIKATAAYHSRTEARGQQYLAHIERAWNRIVAKVAAARASQGDKVHYAAVENTAPATPVPATKPRAVHAIATTHNQRIIKVSDAQPLKKNDILVIRGTPDATNQPIIKTASATQLERDNSPIVTPYGDSVRRVALDNTAASAQPVTATTFVFAN